MNPKTDLFFIDRLSRPPKLRERMEALLNVAENTVGDCTKADDAEPRVIEELRKMGNEALHGWADHAVAKAAEQLRQQQPELHGNGKKKSAGIRPSETSKS
jgi:hypothetical protein